MCRINESFVKTANSESGLRFYISYCIANQDDSFEATTIVEQVLSKIDKNDDNTKKYILALVMDILRSFSERGLLNRFNSRYYTSEKGLFDFYLTLNIEKSFKHLL